MKELRDAITELVISVMTDDNVAVNKVMHNLSVYPLALFTDEARALLIACNGERDTIKSMALCQALINKGFFDQEEIAMLSEAVAWRLRERGELSD